MIQTPLLWQALHDTGLLAQVISLSDNFIATLLALSHFAKSDSSNSLIFHFGSPQFLMDSGQATDLASHQTLLAVINVSSPSHNLPCLLAGSELTLFQNHTQCLTALQPKSLCLSSTVSSLWMRSLTAILIACDLDPYMPLLTSSSRQVKAPSVRNELMFLTQRPPCQPQMKNSSSETVSTIWT